MGPRAAQAGAQRRGGSGTQHTDSDRAGREVVDRVEARGAQREGARVRARKAERGGELARWKKERKTERRTEEGQGQRGQSRRGREDERRGRPLYLRAVGPASLHRDGSALSVLAGGVQSCARDAERELAREGSL